MSSIASNLCNLNSKGFVLIRDCLNGVQEEEIKFGQNAIENDNYRDVLKFTHKYFIPKVKQPLGFKSPTFGIAHMTDNNNPTTFHRDYYAIYRNENEMPSKLVKNIFPINAPNIKTNIYITKN